MEQKDIEKLLEGVAEKNGQAIKQAVKTEMEAAVNGLMKVSDFTAKLEEAGIKKDTIEKLTAAVEAQGEEMRKSFAGKHSAKGIDELIAEKAEDIKKIAKSGNRHSVKIDVPVAKTEVTRASVTSSTQALRLSEIGQLPYLGTKLSGLFRHVGVGTDHAGVIRYMDQSSVTRNAASVAESAVKPESAIAWTERTLLLEKIADSIPVTKEAFADVNFIRGEVMRLLEVNLALKVDDLLYDGDGNTPNIKGVYTSAGTFNYAAYTGPTALDANLFDLALVMQSQIASSKESKYAPNTIIVSPTDFLRMQIVKDDNGVPIANMFFQGGQSFAGMQVVVSPQVTANTMLVGDFRYGTIYDVEGVTVEMGWINDQFVQNTFTILAEQRLGLLVRTVDEDAFLKVTNVTAALNYIGRS